MKFLYRFKVYGEGKVSLSMQPMYYESPFTPVSVEIFGCGSLAIGRVIVMVEIVFLESIVYGKGH